jgi:SAM-dependent methyltransferase
MSWIHKNKTSLEISSPTSLDLSGDRDIEWSWVASRLPDGPGEVLDFGAGGSNLSLIAAQRGFNVTAIDLRVIHRPYVYPRISFIQGDILKIDLPKTFFDIVINCSSVEHVGIVGRYGVTKMHDDGDLKAMERIRSFMKPEGIMILTIPVGCDAVFPPFHRVYGTKRLPILLNTYTVDKEEFWLKNDQNIWVITDKQIALRKESQERLYGLGCFVLKRPGV